jgi:peptidoglycan/LPS O-acetylase OafA/YrhL
VMLGTPDQALLPALILSVVLVVPIAALTYRWIEKPAMDAARRGLSTTSQPALLLRARQLVRSLRASIRLGLAAVRASARVGIAHLRA